MNGVEKNRSGRGNGASVTVRFAIDLAKPTEETTVNEYSYEQLLEERLKGSKNEKSQEKLELPSDDPFSQGSNEELAAIAKKFEEKYGPRKRKKFHDLDLIDRGSGYDISDSFVDDTELYEDYVPHQLDTKFGGFYVNMGGLEFKPADDMEDDELDFISSKKFKKPPKIRKHSSFQTSQAILASQKLKKAKQQMQKTAASGSASKKPPVSKLMGKPVKGILKGPDSSTPVRPPPIKKLKTSKPVGLSPNKASNAASPSKGNTNSPKTMDTSAMLTANISKMMSSLPVVNLSTKLKPSDKVVSGSSNDVGARPSTEDVQITEVPKEPPALPPRLPSLVQDKVVELEQMIVRDQGADGKLSNKARMSYDKHLVDIHVRCQGLPARSRNGVLDYLGYKMGVSRLTLTKRMKQDLKKVEESELGKCMAELKRAIDAAIPEQMQAYESEVRARAESLSTPFTAEKVPDPDDDSHMEEVFEDVTGSSVGPAPQTPSSSQKKHVRKRFRWNEELKRLLCKVVGVKIECEKKWGSWGSKGNPDEIIGNFLDEKIKPLWPKGWMHKSVLLKMSESAHKHYTSVAKKGNNASMLKIDQPSIASSLPATATSTLTMVTVAPAVTATSTAAAAAASASVVQQKPKVPVQTVLMAPSSVSEAVSARSKLENKVNIIKKELEALKSTSQKNGGGIASGGLGGTLGPSGADARKMLLSTSKVKLVSISPSSSSSMAAPKFKSSTMTSSTLGTAPPMKVSTGTITSSAAPKRHHITAGGNPTSITIGTKGGVVLKSQASATTATITATATTPANAVTYLLSSNSLDVAQFIQDLHKQQFQHHQQLPTTTTVTASSQAAAGNKFVVTSTKGLTGKAIAKKPATAKKLTSATTLPTIKTTAVSTSKVVPSTSPSSASKQTILGTRPKPRTVSTPMQGMQDSATDIPQSTVSKVSTSSKPSNLTGVSELLRKPEMQGFKDLVNKLVSSGTSLVTQSSASVKSTHPRASSSGPSMKTMQKEKTMATTQKTSLKVTPQVALNRLNQKAPPSQVVVDRRGSAGSPVGVTTAGSGVGVVPRVSGSGMDVGGGRGTCGSVVVGGPSGVSVVGGAANSGKTGARTTLSTAPSTSTVNASAGRLPSPMAGMKSMGSIATPMMNSGGIGTSVNSGRISAGITPSTGGISVAKTKTSVGGVPSLSSTGVSVINVRKGTQESVRSISVTQVSPKPAAAEAPGHSKVPPPLISADVLDSIDWTTSRSGGPNSAIVIPEDIPPLPLAPVSTPAIRESVSSTSAGVVTSEPMFIPLTMSPSSPLRSPVEQIFEEHSYLATSSGNEELP